MPDQLAQKRLLRGWNGRTHLQAKQRSARMALIGSKDTKPELTVRRILFGLSYRFRLHARDLPGRPDIYFRSRKKAIFVHGCFWHNHEGCSIGHIPKSRSTYWETKFSANRERDERNNKALIETGWKVTTVWECELRDQERLARKLEGFLGNTCHPRKVPQRAPPPPEQPFIENRTFVDVFCRVRRTQPWSSAFGLEGPVRRREGPNGVCYHPGKLDGKASKRLLRLARLAGAATIVDRGGAAAAST